MTTDTKGGARHEEEGGREGGERRVREGKVSDRNRTTLLSQTLTPPNTDQLAAIINARHNTLQTPSAGIQRIVVLFRYAQIASSPALPMKTPPRAYLSERRALVRRGTAGFEHNHHLDRQPSCLLNVPSQLGHFRGFFFDAAGRAFESVGNPACRLEGRGDEPQTARLIRCSLTRRPWWGSQCAVAVPCCS